MDYRVKLPAFSGPLDLLLHLVKRHEVDIHEIQISDILASFLEYLKALETLELGDIGDFVVMASTLMEIKSKELLPRESVDLREELDPRDELIQQLLEYRRYRELTRKLERYGQLRERVASRGSYGADEAAIRQLAREDYEREIEESLDLEDLDAWFLLKAYAKLLEETDFGKTYSVEVDKKPLGVYIDELAGRLLERGLGVEVPFRDAFDLRLGKMEVIGNFMALLELMKQGRLTARQDRTCGEIYLVLSSEKPVDDEEPTTESAGTTDAVDAKGTREDAEA
ncbi:MAG: segregation/condensation protein A [Planctomycetes bacterium]|nr:segregation/condensation protein A [Planctomycetota bacterium]